MSDINGVVDRSEIVNIVAERLNTSPKKVDEVIEVFIAVKNELIVETGHVRVHEEGTYTLLEVPGDSGVTPTGREWRYNDGDRVKVEFKPAQRLKELVENKMGKILID